jgi:hypothetical protein
LLKSGKLEQCAGFLAKHLEDSEARLAGVMRNRTKSALLDGGSKDH